MSKRIQVSIDGIICLADPIQTADIRTGDTLIHIWNDPKSFGEVSLLTVGKADHFKNGIWFSNKKVNAMQDEEGYYITGIDKKDRSDPLGFAIATQSHDSLPNHAFYKAVTL